MPATPTSLVWVVIDTADARANDIYRDLVHHHLNHAVRDSAIIAVANELRTEVETQGRHSFSPTYAYIADMAELGIDIRAEDVDWQDIAARLVSWVEHEDGEAVTDITH